MSATVNALRAVEADVLAYIGIALVAVPAMGGALLPSAAYVETADGSPVTAVAVTTTAELLVTKMPPTGGIAVVPYK